MCIWLLSDFNPLDMCLSSPPVLMKSLSCCLGEDNIVCSRAGPPLAYSPEDRYKPWGGRGGLSLSVTIVGFQQFNFLKQYRRKYTDNIGENFPHILGNLWTGSADTKSCMMKVSFYLRKCANIKRYICPRAIHHISFALTLTHLTFLYHFLVLAPILG